MTAVRIIRLLWLSAGPLTGEEKQHNEHPPGVGVSRSWTSQVLDRLEDAQLVEGDASQ